MSSEHIIIRIGFGDFYCMRCKQSYKPTMPCLVAAYNAIGDAFVKAHKDCKPKKSKEAQ